jgi:hypothetical protein
MKDTRVGRGPLWHGTARRGEAGGVGSCRRLPGSPKRQDEARVMDMGAKGTITDAMVGPRCVRRRHPTLWWRYHLAQDYDKPALRRMRACLAKFDIAGEPRWFDAATGDAAAAIGIAFKYRQRDCACEEFDLAMTALTICALKGSAGARVVMSRMLRCLDDGAAAKNRVANSWLMLAFATKYTRSKSGLSA